MSEVAVVKNLRYFVGARQLSNGDKWFFRVSANKPFLPGSSLIAVALFKNSNSRL